MKAAKKIFHADFEGQILEGCLLSLFQKLLKAMTIILNGNYLQDLSDEPNTLQVLLPF